MAVADDREYDRASDEHDRLQDLDPYDAVETARADVQPRHAENDHGTYEWRKRQEYRTELAHPDRAVPEQGGDCEDREERIGKTSDVAGPTVTEPRLHPLRTRHCV